MRKVLPEVGDYRPGSIRRIKLKHFLTHGDVEFCPGPRLNMVVGANGSGKSTILNAICLGLGGEPKLLGRADDLRAFIMHGKDEAMIEIELAPKTNNNGVAAKPHVIQRFIDRNKGSERGRGRGASTFYVNGEKTTIQAVREIVMETYNIQIDNLCTFLPQDKVGNFSGFTDQERLLETEKTLPTNQFFYKRHMELIEEEQQIDSHLSDVESMRDALKKKKHEFERLEIGKQREEERINAEVQVDLLKKKKVWLEFERQREHGISLKNQKDELKVQLRAAQEELQPLEESRQRLESTKNEADAKLKRINSDIDKLNKEIQKQRTKYEKHDDEMENTLTQLIALDSKRVTLEGELKKTKDKLKTLEDEVAQCNSYENLEQEFETSKEALKSSRNEYKAAMQTDRDLKHRFGEMEERAGELQKKLAKLNDDGARRRENVMRKNPNLAKISEWIETNRGRFRRPVWGPVAVEISTKTQNFASFVEFHVPNSSLNAFVVETNEDRILLYTEIREKLKIPINILNVEGLQLDTSRSYSEEKMNTLKEEHGVECYLDQTFDAPDPVMIALQKFANVNKVLVGGEKTQESIERKRLRDYLSEPEPSFNGKDKLQGSCIFAYQGNEAYRFSQSVSKYSGKVNSKVDRVRPATMLAPGVSEEQKKQVEDDLSSVHSVMAELRPSVLQAEKSMKDLETTTQNLHNKNSSLKKSMENLNALLQKCARLRRKVEEQDAELQSDQTEDKNKCVEEIRQRLMSSVVALQTMGDHDRLLIKYTEMAAGVTANRAVVQAAEYAARQAFEEKKHSFDKLEETAKRVSIEYNDVRKSLIAKKKEADRLAPLTDEDGNDTPLKAKLEELDVSDLAEVAAAIEEAERVLKQYEANPEVIRHYEKLKKDIALAEATLQDFTNEREKSLEMLTDKRKDWESRLENYIHKINVLFSTYMAEMGCTGEVRLTKGVAVDNDDPLRGNFKQWGLEIRVSFREGCKAEVLSAQRHSGGERSVSTIMYLMSLQNLMVAPFRCVDEINQGLDERNERLVFSRIVTNSCSPPKNGNMTDHTGQYFLITPKLLPNLTDMENEAVTVLFVFNGPFSFKSSKEWLLALGADDDSIDVEGDENGNSKPKEKAKKHRVSS